MPKRNPEDHVTVNDKILFDELRDYFQQLNLILKITWPFFTFKLYVLWLTLRYKCSRDRFKINHGIHNVLGIK